MKISAVIPTRNRAANLRTALRSLASQTRPPDEIVVVDSSDDKEAIQSVRKEFLTADILWIDAIASVCLQRNIGIIHASGNWILLCDDDIELSTDYLEKLEDYAECNKSVGAVCGMLLEFEAREWKHQYRVKNLGELLFRFIFQLSIWGEVSHLNPSAVMRPVYLYLKWFYRRRGNGFTLAGWPLITDWNGEAVQTSFYSLGANLIKTEWLLDSRYDEVLDPSGIGDNYGVALGFPGIHSIHVLLSTCAYHHRENENRMNPALIYYRRLLALHYFIKRSKKFSFLTAGIFVWSLLGKVGFFLLKKKYEMVKMTFKAIILIAKRKNPYWIGFCRNEKIIQPE